MEKGLQVVIELQYLCIYIQTITVTSTHHQARRILFQKVVWIICQIYQHILYSLACLWGL